MVEPLDGVFVFSPWRFVCCPLPNPLPPESTISLDADLCLVSRMGNNKLPIQYLFLKTDYT